MMGFHLEYRFERGSPAEQGPCVLVIERARGVPFRQEVQLRDEGSLQGFVPGWRPEEGPFSAHFEDRQGNRLSPSLPLR